MAVILFKSEISSECSWFLLSCQLSPFAFCQALHSPSDRSETHCKTGPCSPIRDNPCLFCMWWGGCLLPRLFPLPPKALTPAGSWLMFRTVGLSLPIQHHLRLLNSWLVICTVIIWRAGFTLSQTISVFVEIRLLINVESLGRQNQCESTAGK